MPVNLSEIARNIETAENGIWVARTESAISYPEIGNESCFAIEDSSFWFRHRNDCILHGIRRYPPPGLFFDVGGGNGFVARRIQDEGREVVLVEPGATGVRNAVLRGIKNVVRSTLQDADFHEKSLPAVGLFDVLEHIEKDVATLADINRLLTANGRLYITVPAFRFLWSQEDKEAGHWRRYTVEELVSKVEATGYRVELATYFFSFLVVPIWLLRVLPSRVGLGRKKMKNDIVPTDHIPQNALIRKFLEMSMRRELARLVAGRPPRFGASCLLVAQKR